jgi:restriction endonuclease Mrr
MNDDIGTAHTRLRRAGLVLRVERGALHVSPRNKITPELRSLITKNRDALIARLQPRRAPDALDSQRLAELQAEAATIDLIERIRASAREMPF